MRLLPLMLLTVAAAAQAATARLIDQRLEPSVTGRTVRVCVYEAQGQQFERAIPMESQCPRTIEVY